MTGSPSHAATPSLSYVVPTIGVSEHLAQCLASVYRDAQRLEAPSELVIVQQARATEDTEAPANTEAVEDTGVARDGETAAEADSAWNASADSEAQLADDVVEIVDEKLAAMARQVVRDAEESAALRELCRKLAAARPGAFVEPPRIVELPRPAGFARAANDGIAESRGSWVALVNDDVVLAPGWARRLLEAASAVPRVGAVQGINLMAGGDGGNARVDGAGLAWNERWQAVQRGRGETLNAWAEESRFGAAPGVPGAPDEVSALAPVSDPHDPDDQANPDDQPTGLPCPVHPTRRSEATAKTPAQALASVPELTSARAPARAQALAETSAKVQVEALASPEVPELVAAREESAREAEEAQERGEHVAQPAEAPARSAGCLALSGSAFPAHGVYGVSATAAVYRRDALAAVSSGGPALRPFEERLESYYEDVELADRLRRAGYRALLAPAARAEHAGALSSRRPRAAQRRTRRVYANRLLVLARRLGRGFWPRLPVILVRDVADASRRPKTTPRPGDLAPPSAVDLVCAWGRAAWLLPHFAHLGSRQGRRQRRPRGRPATRRDPASSPAGTAAEGERPRRPLPDQRVGAPLLTAVAPHWHDEANLADLLRHWPADPRFELLVVDNGSDGEPDVLSAGRSNVRVLHPGRNLGFAGAVNRGAAEAAGDLILILNTDAHPRPGALEALVRGMEHRPEAAGLAPRLLGADDTPQAAWQLRRLPTLRTLVGYCCFVEPAPIPEPARGEPVEQPAACALLLRRSAFEQAGAMDERFWPAWFEDVDLARRLTERGQRVLYWPDAVFRHGLGASVPRLGYGAFLAAYYRNLDRYARKHHGRGAAALLRSAVVIAALLRIAMLPLRRPGRARGPGEALAGLWRLLSAAVAGWRGR